MRVQRTRSAGRTSPLCSMWRRRCKMPLLLASGDLLIAVGAIAHPYQSLIHSRGIMNMRAVEAVGHEDTLNATPHVGEPVPAPPGSAPCGGPGCARGPIRP